MQKIQKYKTKSKHGNAQAKTIWVMYKLLKGELSLIEEVIVSRMNKYTDINVEPDIRSNFFFCSE